MISRRAAIRAILAAPVAGTVNSALAIEYNDHKLTPRLDGELLRVSSPNFNFLSGRSLQRLKDGASVAFVAQLTVSESPTWLIPNARSVARFAVSYDIWEERFSVTTITDRPDQRRTKSHQLAPAAESWCLESLFVQRSELPADRPFYLRLDLRVEDPRDQGSVIGESGINIVSISRWVEVFSRPVRDKQDRFSPWTAGPIRLEDLRGSRG